MKRGDVRSVIQADFADRLATGSYALHHVFQGVNRRRCEEYGFLVALRPAEHNEVHESANTGKALDLKQQCQRFYEKHYGTRKQFINEFGRNYLEE